MRFRPVLALTTLAVLGVASPLAAAEFPTFGTHDIATAFFISKSDDKNRVDYGMRLDENCAAVGDDAVFPYWREFEKSPPVRTHALGTFEYVPYGFAMQKNVKKTPTGGEYAVKLKQFPRPIFLTTKKEEGGRCSVLVRTKIGTTEWAKLESIHAKLGGLMSVDYVDVKGKNLATGEAIEERIQK
ncbi:MAG: DUF4833 domain-containing protein [Polyangiaceae bacterium]